MINQLKIAMTALTFLMVVSIHSTAQEYKVNFDQNLDADFSKFKTYKFSGHVTENNSLVFLLNDFVLKSRIVDAIAHEMEVRDFKYASGDPDLLVNFRVYQDPVQLKGYEQTYRDENYWGQDEIRVNDSKINPKPEVRTDDKGKIYNLDPGTLLVHLVDAEKGAVIWQGYASGLIDGNLFDKNQDHIDKAVHLIFQEYTKSVGDLSSNE